MKTIESPWGNEIRSEPRPVGNPASPAGAWASGYLTENAKSPKLSPGLPPLFLRVRPKAVQKRRAAACLGFEIHHLSGAMVTYVYETIPADGADVRRFEVRQSIFDPPLTVDPATGDPVRRVISGGGNLITQKSKPVAKRHAAACSPNCGCGAGI